jgi:hypothetical protein
MCRIVPILFILLLGLLTTIARLGLPASNGDLGADASTVTKNALQPVAASIVGEELIPLDKTRFSREELMHLDRDPTSKGR